MGVVDIEMTSLSVSSLFRKKLIT